MTSNVIGAALATMAMTVAAFGADDKPREAAGAKENARDASTNQKQQLLESNKLLGASIYNANNEAVADVNTIILDKNGKTLYVIAGVGGVAGVGESEIAIPFEAMKIQFPTEDQELRLSVAMTTDQMNHASKLKAQARAELRDQEWLTKNAEFFHTGKPKVVADTDELVCIASITDASVLGVNSESVGVLDAVIFDVAAKQTQYAVIGQGGVAGVGKTFAVIPYKSLTVGRNADDSSEYVVSTELTREQIERAPQVTPPDYPELKLPSVRERIEGAKTARN
jgi:sporulation protein YlmC with PRC-barrel domain